MSEHRTVRADEIVTAQACPFCKGQFSIARDCDTGNPIILHSLPTCHEFRMLEPDAYVAKINRANGARPS